MSDNRRNATLKALIDAAITELLVKTSGEQIYLDDNTTLSSKMAEMVAAINLRDKKTDVDAKIKTVTDSLNSSTESLSNDISDLNVKVGTLETVKATKEELKSGLATKSNVGHTHDDRYYTETEMDTKISTINDAINLRPTQTAVTEQLNTYAGTVDKKFSDVSTQIKTHTDTADKKFTTIDNTLATKADKTAVAEIKAVTDSLGDLATKNEVSKDDLDTALQTELDAKATTTAVNTKVSTLESSMNTKFSDADKAINLRPTQTAVTEQIAALKQEIMGDLPAEAYDTFTELAAYINEHQEAADALTAAVGDKADKSVVDDILTVINALGALAKKDKVAKTDLDTALQTELNAKATKTYVDEQVSAIDTSLSGKSDSDHTHDDRYYTETEVDTKLKTKSDTSHTHDDRYYTETEIDTKLKTKSDSGHTHGAASTSVNGFMTTTMVTKLNGIDTGANKTVVDSAMSSTSTNPVQNKVVQTALDSKSNTGHTHDDRYYTETEIDTKLKTKSDTGHTHDDRYYTETEVDTKLKTKSDTSHTHDLSTMINVLTVGTDTPSDADYYISQYTSGGTTHTTYHRRSISTLWSYIKGKADKVYAALSHKHTKADITDFPTSMPASDVSAWAKAATKPTYTKSDVGLGNVGNFKAVSTVANQGLTDTEKANARSNIGAGASSFSGDYNDLANRPTVDSALSSSSTNPVQNKVIKSALDGKSDSGHTHGAASTSVNGFMTTAMVTKLNGIAEGANKTTVDSALSSSSTNPVQNKVINTALAGKVNTSAVGNAASRTVRTLTAKGNSGWKDVATDQKYVPDMAFMAYWDGSYNGSASNLTYCNKGAFGSAATKNTGDFAAASHTHTSIVDYGNTSKVIQIGYNGAGISGDAIKFIAGYTTGDGNSVTAKIKDISKGALKAWLGLGSRAYDSTSYLPLAGGTVTGVTAFTSTTASTSKSTGAVKVSGGLGVAGRMSANEVMVGDGCTLKYDPTNKCVNFVFS